MGIYDRDYMRHGYKRPNRGKKSPKRKFHIPLPIVIGTAVLLLTAIIFLVSLYTPYRESEQSGPVDPIIRIDYPLDLNTATFDELMTVPQIGPATAEQIIKNRPFDQLEELLAIYGIGESKLKVFAEYLTITPSESEGSSKLAPE